jgi:hypothetical protein
MTRASTGIWAAPTNSFNPAAAATAIDPDDWNDILTDLEGGLNERIWCALTANYTLTDSSTAQKAFDASSNGTVAVAASTTYRMRAQYLITNTGTTSHTWATLFAGTATLTSIAYVARGRSGDTSAATLTADTSAYTTAATALVVTAASTTATEFVIINLSGVIRVNAAGTLIPQVKLSAQANGTQTMLANSFFELVPICGNAQATVGTWT